MILRELFVALGANTDKAAVDAFNESLEDVKATAGEVVKVLAGLSALAATGAAALLGLAQTTSTHARTVDDQARALGLSVEAFQEMQHVFGEFGGEADDVADAFITLADRAEDATAGAQGIIDDFKLIGISVDQLRGKNPEELFNLYADAIASTTDKTRQLTAADRLLSDVGRRLLPVMAQGSAGIDQMRQEAHRLGVVMDAETITTMREFSDQTLRVRRVLEGFRNQLVAGFIPTLNGMLKRMLAFVSVNRELINTKLDEWGQRIADTFEVVEREARRVNDTVEQLGGWPALFEKAGKALALMGLLKFSSLVGTLGIAIKALLVKGLILLKGGALAAGVALAKPLLIGAAIIAVIAGIVLVVEDLLTWFRGGESVIGGFFDKFGMGEDVKAVLVSIGRFAKSLWDLFVAGAKVIGAAFMLLLKAFGYVLGAFVGMFAHHFGWIFTGIFDAFAWMIGGLTGLLNLLLEDWEVVWAALGLVAKDLMAWLKGLWATFTDYLSDSWQAAGRSLRKAFEGPIKWLMDKIQGLLDKFEAAKKALANPGKALSDAGRGLIARVSGAFAPGEDRNPRTPPGGSNTQNANTQVNVNVEGSNADPADIGREVARGAEKGMGRALRQTQAATAGAEL